MTWVLVRKLLRDIRVAWIVAAVLLFLFQLLWARVTMRVTTQILAALNREGLSPAVLLRIVFNQDAAGQSKEMLGQMLQAIIGGESIALDKAGDLMSVSYVHPMVLTILGIWAIGRAANAIAGEIDRGTMELLLAQPIRRTQVVLAHLWVDAIVFPSLCAAMWLGTYCGTWWMGLQTAETAAQRVDPWRFVPALLCVGLVLFATSGLTMAISSLGRSRARVWGWAITLVLTMFLVNIFGQIWPELEWLRPFTIPYHYQPQRLIKSDDWYAQGGVWFHLLVLAGIGLGGYVTAWAVFCRRDLPAPL